MILKILKTNIGDHICSDCNKPEAVCLVGSKYSTGGLIVNFRYCKDCLDKVIVRLTKLSESISPSIDITDVDHPLVGKVFNEAFEKDKARK